MGGVNLNSNSKSLILLNSLMRMKRSMLSFRAICGNPHLSVIGLLAVKEYQMLTHEGAKISDIAKKLVISKPAATQIINDYEKKGLILRKTDNNDKRITYIRLTEEGEKSLKQSKEELHKAFDIVVDNLGEEDFEEFIRLIKKFNDSLGDFCNNSKKDSERKKRINDETD